MINKEQLKKIRIIEWQINKNLYRICGLITIVVMGMMILEFFGRGFFLSPQIGIFYFGILIIYSFHKELVRWLGEKKAERQGELFVYGWIGLTLVLYLINFLSKDYFNYTSEGLPLTSLKDVCFTTLEVLGVFILTRCSKLLRIYLEK